MDWAIPGPGSCRSPISAAFSARSLRRQFVDEVPRGRAGGRLKLHIERNPMTAKKTKDIQATARAPKPKQASKSPGSPAAKSAATPKATPKPAKAAKGAAIKAPTKKASAPRKKSAIAAKPRTLPPVVVATEAVPSPPKPPSRDRIAARAAEIWRETGGAPFENWIRAERELGA
ncbi:MAG: hypothetical protein KBI44_09250 [Thermoanaerobaculia bacterium]|nr:hypothetical protein [Thermoanaerobaculia bacterium]